MKRQITTIISLLLLVSVTFGSGYILGAQSQQPATAQGASPRDALFAPFWEAWELLHEFYVDPLDDTALMEGALQGMMNAPGDTNTDYMSPDRYAQAREGLSGEYEGIGATVRQDEDTGALIIVRPLPGSPAETAGLLSGDQVVAVDGEDITGLDQDIIISMVRGPAGTEVVLGIRRDGNDEILEIAVPRARIALPSAEYEIFEDNIGYVLLYNFGQDSDVELAHILADMGVENLEGLILDLRGNTGGYLDTTLEIISMFISRGTIFIERGTDGAEQSIQAYGNPIAPTVPMVVLVDNFSASASELVAGALQDYNRATIIGTRTFGKGSVQTWRELSNGGGIRITISRWFTPNGHSVEPDGIEPDFVVEYEPPAEGEVYDRANDNQIQAAVEELRNRAPTGPQASIPVSTGVLRYF